MKMQWTQSDHSLIPDALIFDGFVYDFESHIHTAM